MKRSIASLQERLSDWKDWDMAAFELGVCLGFWMDFGAPHGLDPWHGVKSIMWADNPLGNALHNFLEELVKAGLLEKKEGPDENYHWSPNFQYRWNPKYQGE